MVFILKQDPANFKQGVHFWPHENTQVCHKKCPARRQPRCNALTQALQLLPGKPELIQFTSKITQQNMLNITMKSTHHCYYWNLRQRTVSPNWKPMGHKKDVWKFNSLRPSDAIWWHRSGSTLAQVMACCLTAPRHYLNQCWFIISKV